MAPQSESPVQFAFGARFSKNLYVSLSAVEFRALKLLVAEEPEIGAKLQGSRNSRSLDFAGCVVYYSYEPLFRAICFMDVEKVEWHGLRPPSCLLRLRNFFGV
ncbi:hypothetical protein [Duganella radicis]|uniref:Uncharacterized protein n=1 Tax=Duganella radicis TaxID=551988 RepID=A0A6L6PI38_9BURK|nr:hypothetical protein [Duganella radicis]MTV38389.1 hypothetical protein [Duganella radicis]